MHEELENFERNQVWELVDPPPGCKPFGTKWVWNNKEGEKSEVVRNKSRLVAQGFSQKEGICHTCFSKENQVQTYMHARINFHVYS
jgi:hypothetical protein